MAQAGCIVVSASTQNRLLVGHGMNQLDHTHRVTREVIRCERDRPGALLVRDAKRVPVPGFDRAHVVDRINGGDATRQSACKPGEPHIGSAIIDHSRLALGHDREDQSSRNHRGLLIPVDRVRLLC